MTVPFTVRSDRALLEQLQDLAAREKRSVSFMAAELIREALDQRGCRQSHSVPTANRPMSVAQMNREMFKNAGYLG